MDSELNIWIPGVQDTCLEQDTRFHHNACVEPDSYVLVPFVGGNENVSDRNRVDEYMNNSSTMRAHYERFFTTGESICQSQVH